VKHHPGIRRREFVAGAAALGVGAVVGPLARASSASPAPLDAFVDHDALGLAELVRTKQVGAAELLEVVVRRIEALDPTLRAISTRAFARARERVADVSSRSVFAGVPTLVKDMVDVAGVPRTDGSKLLAGNVPAASVRYIEALERSGLVILGTTNVPELATSAVTDNQLVGATRNPWNLEYSAMGSSGGTAAAVAAGFVPIAHGTDGGGSNRVPASVCGLLGMKPSRGRMLSGEAHGGHDRFRTHQALSRSVRDHAALFDATEDKSGRAFPPIGRVEGPGRRRLRIGYVREGVPGYPVVAEVRERQDAVAELCTALGHAVEEIAHPIDGEEYFRNYNAAYLAKFGALIERAEALTGRPVRDSGILTPLTVSMAEVAESITPEQTAAGLAYLDSVGPRFARLHERHDVILSAVMPVHAARLGEVTAESDYRVVRHRLEQFLCLTAPANVVGAPAMSVPLSHSQQTRLPMGSMFQADVGGDRLLYELAFELEQARPWRDAWAPYSARYVG
jgi:amidase